MRLLPLLRSALTGPRQGLVGALAILTVILGVVTMHSMSGSPTSHGHAVPHEDTAVVSEQLAQDGTAKTATVQAGTGPVLVRAAATDDHAAGDDGSCCDGCGGHDAAMAMCLMVLVALLALVAPARRLLWRAPLQLAASLAPAFAGLRDPAAPSLHQLCISRT
ncbi:DUF6153 family protein [Promicromonospora sp. NPDC019610]|uniref:DUF6153 family protein n=1 Tax=Promicromonospora sp. NPDC019610 TaxID=3364405 RepID=UPI0037AC3E74